VRRKEIEKFAGNDARWEISPSDHHAGKDGRPSGFAARIPSELAVSMASRGIDSRRRCVGVSAWLIRPILGETAKEPANLTGVWLSRRHVLFVFSLSSVAPSRRGKSRLFGRAILFGAGRLKESARGFAYRSGEHSRGRPRLSLAFRIAKCRC